MHIKIIAILLVLASISIPVYAVISSTGNDFRVDIVSEIHDIINHEIVIDIYNLQDINRDFNMGFYMKDLSFEKSIIKDVYIYEWKPVAKEYPIYENVLTEKSCIDENTTESYNCSFIERVQTGIEIKNVLQWKQTKMSMITQPDKVSTEYGSILIPKLTSKDKYDDLGSAYDGGGKKSFKITWRTPIGITSEGFGSSGYFAIRDEISGFDYDPSWNESWAYCRNITITNPKADYPSFLNLTYDSDMNSNFSDIRFVNTSCMNGGYTLDYFIRKKSDSNYAEFDVKLDSSATVISVYYGNADATSLSSATDVWGSSIIHYTTIDEGTGLTSEDLVDVNGFNDGTIDGADWASSYRGGASLDFVRANTDFIDFGDTNDVSEITIEAWIYLEAVVPAGQYYTVMRKWGDPATNTGYALHIDPSEKLYFDLADSGSSMGALLSSDAFSGFPNWYWVAATYNGSYAVIYINGVNEGSKSYGVGIGDTTAKLYYAILPDETTHALEGKLDEVKIYNTGLTPAVIATHYASVEPTFSVGSEESVQYPPFWSSNTSSTPSNYSPSTYSTFNITWINGSVNSIVNTSTVNITLNGVDYSMDLISGDGFNGVYGYQNILGAGSYYWNSTAENNASYPQSNTSNIWSFTINKIVSSCSLTLTPTTPTQYNNTTTATCSCTNLEGTTKLYRNGTDITAQNATPVLLGVATYSYVCNTTETGNYTIATNSSSYVVNQGYPPLDITFNTSSPAIIGGSILANCVYPAELSTGFYNDTAGISKPYIWNTSGFSAGIYNFTCNTTGNSNYTAGTVSESMVLTASGSLIVEQILDEKTLIPLTFNISIYNETFSSTENNIVSYNNNSVRGELTLAISSYGYIERNYYVNISENESANLTGYLLKSTEGVYIDFWGYSSYNPLGEENAIANFSRFIGSAWTLVEQQKADYEGKGIIFLDPYAEYRINVSSEDGSLTWNQDFYSPNPDFILIMNLGGDVGGTNVSWMFSGVNYSLTPTDIYLGRLSNITTICYNISSDDTNIEWFALNLSYWNGTSLYFNNTTTAATGDSICIAVNSTLLNQTLTAQTWLKVADFDEASWSRRYIVWFSGSSIPEALEEIQNLGLATTTENLIAFFVCLGVAIGISKTSWKTGGGIMYLIGMGLFVLYGWFSWEFFLGLTMIEVGMLMKDGFRGW